MLIELHITNFAIIERVDLIFAPGLTIFTGETGAGKSIVIDAVDTILGGRAEATMVRSGSNHALIEGVFRIPNTSRIELHNILEREQLMDDPDIITIAREIRVNGRNVARLNGRSVNVGLLREIGEYLVDVHGQSEHLSLLRVPHHLELLDSYTFTDETISVAAILAKYRNTYQNLMEVREQLEHLRWSEKDAARRADMLNFQIKEIQAANLQTDEERTLLEERNRLANSESLAKLVQECLIALDENTSETPTTIELLGQVVHALTNLVRLDAAQSTLLERAQTTFEEVNDLTSNLRNYLESIEFNPRRLDQVEERLALIDNLKRKYGDSIPEILGFLEQAEIDLEDIENSEERIAELEISHDELLKKIGLEGMALSHKRRGAAEKLSASVEHELDDLNMSQAGFRVDFQLKDDPEGVPIKGVPIDDGRKVAFNPHGLERVEFLIAPNPGEGFKPLTKIASGGETSRLMLAIKNVLAHADQIPSLIFDEIDQGIGGRVGTIVGEKMWSLARQHQVFCITHLPQLAAFGDHHYQVQKQVSAGRTTTQVKSLHGQERIVELAQMMGELSEGNLYSARELSDLANKRKN